MDGHEQCRAEYECVMYTLRAGSDHRTCRSDQGMSVQRHFRVECCSIPDCISSRGSLEM